MNPRLQTLVIGGILLLAALLLLGKLMMNSAPQKAAPVCESVAPTLGADVKGYIDLKAAQNSGAANSDLLSRLEKLEVIVADLRKSGVSSIALSQKISELEKQVSANQNLSELQKSTFLSEFRRLKHTLLYQCAPQKAKKI